MNGWCMIFRLEVDDYHRYCYIDGGEKTDNFFMTTTFWLIPAIDFFCFYEYNAEQKCKGARRDRASFFCVNKPSPT